MQNAHGRTNKLLFTGCVLISLTAGWLQGSITIRDFSQAGYRPSGGETLHLTSVYIYGEALPTIILSGIQVTAE